MGRDLFGKRHNELLRLTEPCKKCKHSVKDHLLKTLSCLIAAGGSSDLAILHEQCLAAGPELSDFIRLQIEKRDQVIAAAERLIQAYEMEDEGGRLSSIESLEQTYADSINRLSGTK